VGGWSLRPMHFSTLFASRWSAWAQKKAVRVLPVGKALLTRSCYNSEQEACVTTNRSREAGGPENTCSPRETFF
jgi:hypothetical protein